MTRCLAVSILALLVVPLFFGNAVHADEPEGIYAACYRYNDDGPGDPVKEDADSCDVTCRDVGTNEDVVDETGDEYPQLDYNVARFSRYPPPGELINFQEYYILMASKVYGTQLWESDWSDTIGYLSAQKYDVELILENTYQTVR